MIRTVIVDDCKETREVLRSLLRYRPEIEIVGEAPNMSELLLHLNTSPVDLITLDYQLGDQNGVQVCQEIHRQFPNLFIAMCSVEGKETIRQCAREAGCHYYLTKPVSSQELSTLIQAYLLFHEKMTLGDSSADGMPWIDQLLQDMESGDPINS